MDWAVPSNATLKSAVDDFNKNYQIPGTADLKLTEQRVMEQLLCE